MEPRIPAAFALVALLVPTSGDAGPPRRLHLGHTGCFAASADGLQLYCAGRQQSPEQGRLDQGGLISLPPTSDLEVVAPASVDLIITRAENLMKRPGLAGRTNRAGHQADQRAAVARLKALAFDTRGVRRAWRRSVRLAPGRSLQIRADKTRLVLDATSDGQWHVTAHGPGGSEKRRRVDGFQGARPTLVGADWVPAVRAFILQVRLDDPKTRQIRDVFIPVPTR